MKKWILITSLFLLTSCSTQQIKATEDVRQDVHGVAIIENTVLWSEKSEEQREDGWTHDIYKKEIGQTAFDTLVINPEAQEPVSASATDETIAVTYEDGYEAANGVAQRFKLYDHDWQLIHEATLFDGGHSGHVASTKAHHVIFWSNDWVDGGGVNELGTGKEVIVSTISNDGKLVHETKLSTAEDRDSWPLPAASDDNALLIWQHFDEKATRAALYFAVYDPATNDLTVPPTELLPQVNFYMYSVSYIPKTAHYVVAAQTEEGAKLLLLTKDGGIIDQTDAPALVQEATPAIRGNTLVFPQQPTSYFTVQIVDNKLQLQDSEELDYTWQTMGTTGVFLDNQNVYFATLNADGLQEVFIELP